MKENRKLKDHKFAVELLLEVVGDLMKERRELEERIKQLEAERSGPLPGGE